MILAVQLCSRLMVYAGEAAGDKRSLVLVLALISIAGVGAVACAEPPIGAQAGDGQVTEQQIIYRYTNAQGRTAYVNDLARVPRLRRARARPVDLSQVSLNEKLAAQLEQTVDEQLDRLLKSDYCAEARLGADRGFLRTLWQQQGHWLLASSLLLIFIVASPYLMRTLGPPRWAKLLMVVVPVLGLLAMMGSAAVKTSESLDDLRVAAEPCRRELYGAPPATPAGRAVRRHRLYELRARVEAAHRMRAEQLQRAVGVEAPEHSKPAAP